MKEKTAKKYSMNDLVLTHQDNSNPMERQESLAQEQVKDEYYDQEMITKIQEYNANITELNPLYSTLVPLKDVLLRVYLTEPEVNDGLIIPHKQIVSVPTQNGMATWYEIESEFPYSTQAVVVAVPNLSKLQPKDKVILNNNQVQTTVSGKGNEAIIKIKSAFVHPDSKMSNIPRDPSNPHYGYLLVPEYEIQFKIG